MGLGQVGPRQVVALCVGSCPPLRTVAFVANSAASVLVSNEVQSIAAIVVAQSRLGSSPSWLYLSGLWPRGGRRPFWMTSRMETLWVPTFARGESVCETIKLYGKGADTETP